MANLYEEGVLSSPTDLMVKLLAFASSVAGFTTGSYNDGTYDIYYAEKNGMTFRFRESSYQVVYYLACYMSPDSGSLAWLAHTTVPSSGMGVWLGETTGPYTHYWFFTEPSLQVIHAVVEVQPGVYNHLSFGLADRAGTYNGGHYMTSGFYYQKTGGVYNGISTSYHYHPFGSQNMLTPAGHNIYNDLGFGGAGNYANLNGELNSQRAHFSGLGSHGQYLLNTEVSPIAHRAPLLPAHFYLFETNDNLYWPGGTVPGVAHCRLDYLLPQEITQTDWQVFPVCEKDGDGITGPNSNKYGLAYRRYVI